MICGIQNLGPALCYFIMLYLLGNLLLPISGKHHMRLLTRIALEIQDRVVGIQQLQIRQVRPIDRLGSWITIMKQL
jgi:hypothetical protein